MTKSNTCLFTTVLCLIPENVYGSPETNKQTGNGLAAGCQLIVKSTDIFCSLGAKLLVNDCLWTYHQ